ncbi:amine oxidase [Annulohypoxylon maeteangense]|uniref:amine oxidase n=1 Tax=Annulohypoxylon maeteangense TaxID=1927788 RepID=UPI00200871F8|nr:amine oxidase [Annulohypoxylon maeteangense]KAI0882400.1 amine oxidase [Annulohypoxylon maeteangense]
MTSSTNRVSRKKVAIVGSGSAGIGALWALNRTHHDVYLYEAGDRLGGHTNTVEWKKGKFTTLVDTGFIVLNTATYPNFINFLKNIKVNTVPTQMTFGVSRDQGKFEWAGTNLDSVFSQKRNIFSLKMWRLIFDIIRFNQFALDLLKDDDGDDSSASKGAAPMETIGQYLDREGYSETFRNDYLIPMTAAVWSTSPDKCTLEFPAVTLIRFMWNHHLLSTVAARPDWLTLEGGAKSYIDAVMSGFPPNHLFLKTAVKHVTSEKNGRVRLHLENGKTEVFDHVILATHGDQAYQIIKPSATPEEEKIMSSFKTSENTCILHSDLSHMPQRKKSWSAWNYLTVSSPWTGKDIDQVSLTYNMNILQHIPKEGFGDVLVTLNPIQEPKPETIQGRYSYSHPLYTPDAIRAQQALPKIQNTRGISYAGAWTKYGFHEDGFSSGIHAASAHLGAKLPFEFVDSTYSRGKKPKLGITDLVVKLIIMAIQVFVVDILEWIFGKNRRKTLPKANGASKKILNDKHSYRANTTSQWACASCRRALARTKLSPPRRTVTNSARAKKAQATHTADAPSMERMAEYYRYKNRSTMYYTLSIILGTVAFSYGSVPMYKMICQTTGWGGQPIRAPSHGGSGDFDPASRVIPVTDARRIRVTFNASVSDILPWKFVPQQREVRVLPGETALAFYTATNRSDSDIIGVATYSVTPAQVAPYFSKIQCFCFEEQRLNAGETVDMPVFFYLDPDLLNDLNMRGINEVTLSYTFFKAKYDNNGNFRGFPTTS